MNRKAALSILVFAAVLIVAWGFSHYGRGTDQNATSTDSGTTTTVPVATQPGSDWQEASSDTYGFSVRYPQGWRLEQDYENRANAAVSSNGYAFRVPAALTEGTNLSEDSAMIVEVAGGDGPACAASWFISDPIEQPGIEENGRSWSVAKGGDAGAGNFYDETVYWSQIGERCYGLRLFIHSTNIGNYDPGTVTEFDRTALDSTFAQFRATFTTK